MSDKENNNTVYSTDPNWKKDVEQEDSGDQSSVNFDKSQTAYIERDRKGRKGKVVTVVSRLKGDLRPLQKELQKHCGAGGSVKNGTIEIQGDHRDKIAEYLGKKGLKIKFIGG
ncbi:MAG: translation initiation factor [Calditrichaceae bacterium]